jgi:hypothetical protein
MLPGPMPRPEPFATIWSPSADLGAGLPTCRTDHYGRYCLISCGPFTGTVVVTTNRAQPGRQLKAYIKLRRDGKPWRRLEAWLTPLQPEANYWAWFRSEVAPVYLGLMWSCLRAYRVGDMVLSPGPYRDAFVTARRDGTLVPPEVARQFRRDLWPGDHQQEATQAP